MAFMKKLFKGKKKVPEVKGESSAKSQKETDQTSKLSTGDDKPSGLSMEADKPAGHPMKADETADLPMETDKTADIPIADDKPASHPIEGDKTASFPMEDDKTTSHPTIETELATFALGCFWHPESQFGCVHGVLKTRVGFTGGTKEEPTYTCLGDHTETVEITFDPIVTNYSAMLKLFWENHDPTLSVSSSQYMSAIFYHSDTQKKLAEESSVEKQKEMANNILTMIVEAETFYNAENDHQKYFLHQHQDILKSLQLSDTELITSNIACRINGFCGGNGTSEQLESELPSFNLEPQVEEQLRKIVSGSL